MLDPATCGPATLAFCQDAQTEAFDFPARFFERRVWRIRRPAPDPREVDALAERLRAARAPLLIAGGGVLYSGAEAALAALAERVGVPVGETQAGRGAMAVRPSDGAGRDRRHRDQRRQRRGGARRTW